METNAAAQAKEWLEKWDKGESVPSIEMGGMSMGYEQCIQTTAAEMIRWFISHNSDASLWENKNNWTRERELLKEDMLKLKTVDDLNLSMAQYGAAVSLATSLYMQGTVKLFSDETLKDRIIQVSKLPPTK